MGRSLNKFETLRGLRHRNLVSSAAQCFDTYRSWPAGQYRCRVLVWWLFPLIAGVAGYCPFLVHRESVLESRCRRKVS